MPDSSSPPAHVGGATTRVLVTGAAGCIGAWVVRDLVQQGIDVVAFDLNRDTRRLELIMEPADLAAVEYVQGDITDLAGLERVLDQHRITNVIHLAALQVPFCRADPPLGAHVNVVGTVNVFQAVERRGDHMAPIVYASSIAAYDAADGDTAPTLIATPGTLYGVFKRANEGTAEVFHADLGVASIGLRPHTVFGPGRDQGLTSSPTQAMLAAAAGRPFHIPYGGRGQFQYAPDVAHAFVRASFSNYTGCTVLNLAGAVVDMADVVAAVELAAPQSAGTITFDDVKLPFPDEVETTHLLSTLGPLDERHFDEAVADTIERFRTLLADGRIVPP